MKKLHINRFVIGYAVALLSLAFLGWYIGVYNPKAEVHSTTSKSQKFFATDLTYYDLPRITMKLHDSGRAGRVNMDISLEVAKKDAHRLEDFQSRITDSIITYMYQQEISDMRSPKDIAWLHRDLLKVINTTNQPVLVHDIIFREFVIM